MSGWAASPIRTGGRRRWSWRSPFRGANAAGAGPRMRGEGWCHLGGGGGGGDPPPTPPSQRGGGEGRWGAPGVCGARRRGAEGLSQQELAAARLTTKGNLSQLLDNMERDGLVRRERDGRCKRIRLTNAGRKLYEEVVPAHEALLTEQFRALAPEDQSRLHG